MEIKYEEMLEFEKKIKLGSMPYAVIVEPTSYCNLHCKMCMNKSMKRHKGYMNDELYKKIIDELAEKHPSVSLWLNGMGEPILDRSLSEKIRYAHNKGLTNISVNTNATLLTKETAEEIVDSGLNQIVCGIDAYDKEIYESIRIGGDKDKVYENINYLLELVNTRPGCGLKVEVQQIEMEDNREDQARFTEYWRGRGAYLKIIPYQTWLGWAKGQWKVGGKRIACSKINMFQIFWDGTVPLCGCDYEARSAIGNINESSIEELWSIMKNNLGVLHIDHRFDELPIWCQNCTDWIMHESRIYDADGNLIEKKLVSI